MSKINACWMLTFHLFPLFGACHCTNWFSQTFMPQLAFALSFLLPLFPVCFISILFFFLCLLNVCAVSSLWPSPPISPADLILLTWLSEGPPTLIPISFTISTFPRRMVGCLVYTVLHRTTPFLLPLAVCLSACPSSRKHADKKTQNSKTVHKEWSALRGQIQSPPSWGWLIHTTLQCVCAWVGVFLGHI